MRKLIFTTCALILGAHCFCQEQNSLPHLYTYIDSTVVEQRQVFTADDIEKTHAESLTDFCQSAGMQILSYGPYGLEQKPSIRGFTDETVRVVIDGICVNNAQYGTFDFTSISLDDVERIEIVRGGFTEGVSDEGAVGGVIYITTKQQKLGTHFNSDTSVKSFFNANYPLDTISQSLGFSKQLSENDFLKLKGKFTWAQNKFHFKDYAGRTVTRENSDVMDGSGTASWSHFYGDGNSVTVSDSFYGGNKNCPSGESLKEYGTQKDYDNRLTLGFHQPEIFSGFTLENNIAWLKNLRFYDEGSSSSRHDVNTVSYSCYGDFHKYNFFQESVGFTFDYVHLDSTDDGTHDQFSGTFKETSKIKFNDVFSMSIPLAVKFCGDNVEFIPKLGLKAETKYVDFLLNGYRMIQFPNMDDLYWDSNGFHGNPDLKAENGWGGEFTVNVHDWWVPFSLCAYTNYYENKIQWSNTSGVWQPENVASAFYAGINFSSEKQLFDELLVLRASVEYLYSALMDKSNALTYKKRIMWTPDWVYSLSATLNLKYFMLTVEDNYVGIRYKSNLNVSYMEPYSLVNVVAQLDVWEKVKPYLRLENLLDVEYEAVDSYPMPGISLAIGVRMDF